MVRLPARVLFGAAYYHEYQPRPRLTEDFDLMQQAGFSVIRVGESVWSTWEPEDGVFDLEWLQPVLDEAHARGIAVILGTPTYAVPMWLVRRYPEIAAENRTGVRAAWGARQEVDYTHPAFRFHADRIIRAVVGRYAAHPAVIGYQVDNEPGTHLFHNTGVFQRFVDELRHTYGSVEALNSAWGLTYWSHRLSTWADLWHPDGNAQPQYALAWQRFQALLTTEFIAWQAAIVREYATPDQFVTTCIAYAKPALHDLELAGTLDVTAGNPYYRTQDSLRLPNPGPGARGWLSSGLWTVRQSADQMYATRQEPFLITETNAAAIFGPTLNEPPWDGQLRQLAWLFVSRGARMIEYWHWHTTHAGTETYWGGILPHSQEPGRIYRQVAALGAEFAKAGPRVAGLVPDADISFLYDHDSRWSLEISNQRPVRTISTDALTWDAAFDALYRGAFDAGLQAGILHSAQLLALAPAAAVAAHPVLVAAGIVAVGDDLLRWLGSYAEAGGHLVVGVRTGYEDAEARARLERKPALLDAAAGAWYDEINTVAGPVPVRAPVDSPLRLPDGARGTRWIDGLTLDPDAGAQVLATYEHPHFSRFPAVTSRSHGAGRVTTVGTVPNVELARALARWLVPDGTPWRPADRSFPESVTVTGATAPDGSRLRFVHNWSWTPAPYPVPAGARDVLSGEAIGAGTALQLGPWDVRVLVEEG